MKCSKRRHDTNKAAKKWMKEYNKTHREVTLTDAYYCTNCCGWHLTSMAKSAARRLKKFNEKRGL